MDVTLMNDNCNKEKTKVTMSMTRIMKIQNLSQDSGWWFTSFCNLKKSKICYNLPRMRESGSAIRSLAA